MTTDEKKEKIRVLMGHLADRAEELLFKRNCLEGWKITDPQKVDEYYKLQDLLDQSCSMYLNEVVPLDRDLILETEVIQVHPEDTPVTVQVKRYDFRPSVMQAARDLFLFIALP